MLRETSAKLPNGLILKNGTLGLLLEKLIPSIVSASSGQKQITDKNSFFSDLRKLVSKEFVFPKDLQDEVLGQVKKLSYPLVIATSAKVDNKTDLLSFEMVIFEKEELLPTLKTAFFSPLNPLLIPEISYESLKRLSLAIKITEKPQAEVSGKVLANKQSVKIFSQWGEFDPNSSSDQTIFSQNRVKEENYQPVLQANQIVLKNKKYVLINVAKQFQFATKLDSTNTEKLAKVAESISRKIVSPIELRFSVCDDEVFVTDLLINEIPEQIETVPLIDFLTLYKKLSPVVMGVRSGPLRKIVSQKDLKNLRRGEIAVVRHLDKRVFPALKKLQR